MVEKKILIDFDDEKAAKVASVLSSKASKKILSVLAEDDYSEGDLAEKLKMPLNTVEYNLKNLVSLGLVEKTKTYFWSKRGKKIPVYKISRKQIVISPKISKSIKSVAGAGLFAGAVALLLKVYQSNLIKSYQYSSAEPLSDSIQTGSGSLGDSGQRAAERAIESSPDIITGLASPEFFPIWLWFLAGAFFALLVFVILNWRRL